MAQYDCTTLLLLFRSFEPEFDLRPTLPWTLYLSSIYQMCLKVYLLVVSRTAVARRVDSCLRRRLRRGMVEENLGPKRAQGNIFGCEKGLEKIFWVHVAGYTGNYKIDPKSIQKSVLGALFIGI